MVLKKYFIVTCCFLFILLESSILFGAGKDASSKKLMKILSKELDTKHSELLLEEISNTCFESELIESVSSVFRSGEKIGFVITAMGIGRYDEFYYLIFYNEDREVEFVRVMTYYSDHGGEIRSKRWLAQFVGYDGGDLGYGDEVQAISGATLSAGAIVKGIRDITIIMQDCEL